jgi:hypothetical protein
VLPKLNNNQDNLVNEINTYQLNQCGGAQDNVRCRNPGLLKTDTHTQASG